MPIRGVTDRYEPGRGLPRLGKLVKGAERTADDIRRKRPGADLDHFRVKFDQGFEHLEEAWNQLYGSEVRIIRNVYLLTDDVDLGFGAWMEEWGSSGLIRRCDGEQQVRWFDSSQGRCVTTPIDCAAADGCACKQVGRLHFILPELTAATGSFGFFTLETHAITDISRMTNALRDVQTLYGKLVGVPLSLMRVEEEITQPELDKETKRPTGRRMHIKKWLIQLRVDEEFARREFVPSLVSGSGTALPAPQIDRKTGEITPSPALPPPTPSSWTREEAQRWAKTKMDEYSLTQNDLFAALGISKLSEWHGSVAEAEEQLATWLDAALAGEHDELLEGGL